MLEKRQVFLPSFFPNRLPQRSFLCLLAGMHDFQFTERYGERNFKLPVLSTSINTLSTY
jgi:hypothetical protein